MAVYSYKYEDLGGDHYRRSLTLDEQHIYGSSRHAVSKPAALVYGQEIELTPGDFDGEGHLVGGYSVLSTTDNTGSPYQYTITRGKKYYEISNHLGNVMSTLRDRKLPQESTGDIISFLPDVSSWQDYLPFGMLMYNRNGDDGEVGRYGFQAQERDDEIKGAGNSIDYKFRMHDPRLGRFFAVDPLAHEFPWNSPFAFSENSVIAFIELEGLEKVPANQIWDFTEMYTTVSSHYVLDIGGAGIHIGAFKLATINDVTVRLYEIVQGPNKGNYYGVTFESLSAAMSGKGMYEWKYVVGADLVTEKLNSGEIGPVSVGNFWAARNCKFSFSNELYNVNIANRYLFGGFNPETGVWSADYNRMLEETFQNSINEFLNPLSYSPGHIAIKSKGSFSSMTNFKKESKGIYTGSNRVNLSKGYQRFINEEAPIQPPLPFPVNQEETQEKKDNN